MQKEKVISQSILKLLDISEGKKKSCTLLRLAKTFSVRINLFGDLCISSRLSKLWKTDDKACRLLLPLLSVDPASPESVF